MPLEVFSEGKEYNVAVINILGQSIIQLSSLKTEEFYHIGSELSREHTFRRLLQIQEQK
jgi:hypothetical protein